MSLKEKITKAMPWNWGKMPVPVRSTAPSVPALRRDIDSMFDALERDLLRSRGAFPALETEDLWGKSWPRLDLEETEEEIRVTAEVPGVEEKDLTVTVDDDLLTIRGNRRDTREGSEEGFYRRETYSGSFRRSIRLPTPVDPDRAEATCRRGELVVRLPKKEADRLQTRRIAVH